MDNFFEEEKICSNIYEVLDIIGTKWAFVVIAELYKGPKRFNELKRKLANVKTQSLTNTLRHLEKNSVVRRQVFPTVPVTVEYSLTDKGSDFKSVLMEMNRWAVTWNLRMDARTKLGHNEL